MKIRNRSLFVQALDDRFRHIFETLDNQRGTPGFMKATKWTLTARDVRFTRCSDAYI